METSAGFIAVLLGQTALKSTQFSDFVRNVSMFISGKTESYMCTLLFDQNGSGIQPWNDGVLVILYMNCLCKQLSMSPIADMLFKDVFVCKRTDFVQKCKTKITDCAPSLTFLTWLGLIGRFQDVCVVNNCGTYSIFLLHFGHFAKYLIFAKK